MAPSSLSLSSLRSRPCLVVPAVVMPRGRSPLPPMDHPPLATCRYDEVHRGLAARGQRVLCVAHRRLTSEEAEHAKSSRAGELLDRSLIESGLTFDGFASFACLLRTDSASVVEELKNADNRVAMVTGTKPSGVPIAPPARIPKLRKSAKADV